MSQYEKVEKYIYRKFGEHIAEALGHEVTKIDEVAGLASKALVGAASRVALNIAKKRSKKHNKNVKEPDTKDEVYQESSEPTDDDIKSAKKSIGKKTVVGEDPKQTKKFDKSVDKAMGKAKKGPSGIEHFKARIRAAGEAAKEKSKNI